MYCPILQRYVAENRLRRRNNPRLPTSATLFPTTSLRNIRQDGWHLSMTPLQSPLLLVTTQLFTFGQSPDEMVLDSGEKLGPITLAYETYGKLNAEGSNAILACHALSGDAHAAGISTDEGGVSAADVGFGAAGSRDRGSEEAGLVGRYDRPRQGLRYGPLLRHLLQRHRRLQGLHRPGLDQPRRRASPTASASPW